MNLDLISSKEGTRPLVCVELNPPRGTEVDAAIEKLTGVRADFVNVTDCALAKLRLSGLMFGALVKQRTGLEPLVNLSCRDRNSIALQSDLLGAWAMGVRSVVCLTGDAVTVGDAPDAKGVFEVNSIGLLKIVKGLAAGHDNVGVALKGAPAFVPGVVVNPNVRNPSAELRRLEKKRDAGGVYALSQPVFDVEAAVHFLKLASGIGVKIFLGLHPFRSMAAAEALSNVPGIRVPEGFLAMVRGTPDPEVAELSMMHALEIAEATKPYVTGFHIISGPTPKLAFDLVNRVSAWARACETDALPRDTVQAMVGTEN